MHARCTFVYEWGGVGDEQCDATLNFATNDGAGNLGAVVGYESRVSLPGNTGLIVYPVYAVAIVDMYIDNQGSTPLLISLAYKMDASSATILRVNHVEWDIHCA